MSDLTGGGFIAVEDMEDMGGGQGNQEQVQGLCVDLVNKSVARTTSVNKSFGIGLSTT